MQHIIRHHDLASDCLTTLINSMIVFRYSSRQSDIHNALHHNLELHMLFHISFRTNACRSASAFSAIYIHCKGIDITAIICSQYKTAICPNFSFQYRSIPIQIKARIDLCIFFDRYFAVSFPVNSYCAVFS